MTMMPTTPATAKPGGIQRAGRRIESHANQIAPITKPIRVRADIRKSLVDCEPVQFVNQGVAEAIAAAVSINAATIPAIGRRKSGGEEVDESDSTLRGDLRAEAEFPSGADGGPSAESSPSLGVRWTSANAVRSKRMSNRE